VAGRRKSRHFSEKPRVDTSAYILITKAMVPRELHLCVGRIDVAQQNKGRQRMVAKPKWAWMNGQFLPWDDCKLHIRTQVVMMGGSVFEGIRAYWNDEQTQLYIFKMREHFERLQQGCRVMHMRPIPITELEHVCVSLLRRNDFREDVHLVPVAYLGYGEGFLALTKTLDEGLFVSAIPRPAGKWLEVGKNVRVSSWRRISDSSMPPRIKASGNYQNGRLALLEAWQDGFDDTILLNERGTVAESAGSCVMMVRGGTVCTPPVTAGILESITRTTLIGLLEDYMDIRVIEREIDRTELYSADEMFLCGSGMEVVPVVSVDRLAVGDGRKGRITAAIQKIYFDIARGCNDTHANWRTPVYGGQDGTSLDADVVR
jgi:branched-chain amino acid aminotransferase